LMWQKANIYCLSKRVYNILHLLQDKYENGQTLLLRICKDGIFPLFTPGPRSLWTWHAWRGDQPFEWIYWVGRPL